MQEDSLEPKVPTLGDVLLATMLRAHHDEDAMHSEASAGWENDKGRESLIT